MLVNAICLWLVDTDPGEERVAGLARGPRNLRLGGKASKAAPRSSLRRIRAA